MPPTTLSRIIPPYYLMGSIFLMVCLHIVAPVAEVIPASVSLIGLIPSGSGAVLVLWGASLFRKASTPLRPFTESTAIVSEGPFRFSRNPIYLGMILILLGVFVLLGSLTPLLILGLFCYLISVHFVRVEEQVMLARFGKKYEEYFNAVPRWFWRW